MRFSPRGCGNTSLRPGEAPAAQNFAWKKKDEPLIEGFLPPGQPGGLVPLPHACLPFIIREFVSVVIRGYDIHQQDVLRFWVESSDLHFVTGEHSPVE